ADHQVRHVVIHESVLAWFRNHYVEYRAGAGPDGVGGDIAQRVRRVAIRIDLVEHRADNVERRPHVGAGVDEVDANAIARDRDEWTIAILKRDAVEDHFVGPFRHHPVIVGGHQVYGRLLRVPLALQDDETFV